MKTNVKPHFWAVGCLSLFICPYFGTNIFVCQANQLCEQTLSDM